MTKDKITFRARVTSIKKGLWTITEDTDEMTAVLSGKMAKSHKVPVVGDWVLASRDAYGSCVILDVEQRKSVFARPNRGGHSDGYVKTMLEEPIVANFDYVFIICSMNKNFNVNRIARYAATTLSGGGIPVAVLTKADLCDDVNSCVHALHEACENLEIHPVSSVKGTGLESLQVYMKPGTTIALLGSSGVGKSTLLNTLAGHEVMKVSAVREGDDKGHHTTTHRQLFEIGGVSFIDTPGMRELGMGDVEEGIDDTFPDIADIARQCRFRNCTHRTEPGCAVRSALESGLLSAERWEMFTNMRSESDRAASMMKKKRIAIQQRAMKKG